MHNVPLLFHASLKERNYRITKLFCFASDELRLKAHKPLCYTLFSPSSQTD